jgi:hypothetical protein
MQGSNLNSPAVIDLKDPIAKTIGRVFAEHDRNYPASWFGLTEVFGTPDDRLALARAGHGRHGSVSVLVTNDGELFRRVPDCAHDILVSYGSCR